jgi:hypothetical protein
VASSDSFRSALFSAIEIVQMRMQVDEMTKNPLKKQKEKN